MAWMGGNTATLGRLHYLLEDLVFVDGAISVPGRDATGQDTLDGAAVVLGEYPGVA